jgi:hypothetical protein
MCTASEFLPCVGLPCRLRSRKNAREFLEAFFRVLPRALHHMLAKSDEKTRAAVHKVIRVWDERKVRDALAAASAAGMAAHHCTHVPHQSPDLPQAPRTLRCRSLA